MIENYLYKLSNLRTDRGRERYPACTFRCAAHKPFLLLSIMDLIAQGSIAENFIEPSFELVETFNDYWNSIMPLAPIGQLSIADFRFTKEVSFFERVIIPSLQFSKLRRPDIKQLYDNIVPICTKMGI